MKYRTQEWYMSVQRRFIPRRASKKAEVFSEEYFQSLYRRKLREWLKDISEDPDEEYDEVEERREFAEMYARDLARLPECLPEEILDQVADLRVLALGVASAAVKRQIEKYDREMHRQQNKREKEYWAGYQKLMKKHPGSFLERFHFHDAEITGVRRRGRNLIIALDNGRWDTCENEVTQITFVNCEILRRDAHLKGADWLYEEVYELDGGWEIHVLAYHWRYENPLAELIVRAEDVRLK